MQFYKDSFAKLNNNPKKPIVLLSFGGAGAPAPKDVTSDQIISAIEKLSTILDYPIAGIDWDYENSANSSEEVSWMASISAELKQKKGYIITAAPQSTNFNWSINRILYF